MATASYDPITGRFRLNLDAAEARAVLLLTAKVRPSACSALGVSNRAVDSIYRTLLGLNRLDAHAPGVALALEPLNLDPGVSAPDNPQNALGAAPVPAVPERDPTNGL